MITSKQSFQDIREGRFSPLYLLTGSEDYLQELWLGLLQDRFLHGDETGTGFRKVEGHEADLPEIIADLEMPMLFSTGKKIVLIDDFPPLLSAVNPKKKKPITTDGGESGKSGKVDREDKRSKEALAIFQEQQNSRPEIEHIIVFRAAEVDRRRSFYRFLQGADAVVMFSPLKGRDLDVWVRSRLHAHDKKADPRALDKLLFIAEGDLRRVDAEISKIVSYMHTDEHYVTEELVDKLVYSDPRGNIFNLVDSLGEGLPEQSFRYLKALLALRTPPLQILHMIARQFRLILKSFSLREEGVSRSAANSELGVRPFVVDRLFRQAQTYRREELREIIRIIQETDFQIKTGKTEPELALELLIGRIAALMP